MKTEAKRYSGIKNRDGGTDHGINVSLKSGKNRGKKFFPRASGQSGAVLIF